MKSKFLMSIFFLLLTTGSAQTGTPTPPPDLTIYTGRNAAMVSPLTALFESRTGLHVRVVYDSDAALLTQLGQEGTASPADVYWGNGAQSLYTLQPRLVPLPARLFTKLTPSTVSAGNFWLPTNVRYRMLAYNTDRIKAADLPASVLDLPKMSSLKGRIGWTVADPTFTEFVAALISLKGEDAARQWLEGMKALSPRDYGTENRGMVEAVNAGDLDAALTVHPIVQRLKRAAYHIDTQFFQPGDLGNLSDESGAGMLVSSRHRAAALRFLELIGSSEAQAFSLSVNFEYPTTADLPFPTTLLPAADISRRAPTVAPQAISENLERAHQLLIDLDLL